MSKSIITEKNKTEKKEKCWLDWLCISACLRALPFIMGVVMD